jgi:hypothetical protein
MTDRRFLGAVALLKRFALALILAVILVVLLLGSPAGAANCKAATKGAIRYNSTSNYIEFCNGKAWTALVQVRGSPTVTAPAGSGYFVMSYGTWNGDLQTAAGVGNGLGAADALCLSDLTTHTGWRGYSTANSGGLLNSAHVHAFLCGGGNCNNLMPLTTYYFASANDVNAGGASCATDSSAIGPNDNGNWSAANYFSGTFTYWSGRYGSVSTAWTNTQSGLASPCGGDYSGSSSVGSNEVGTSTATDQARWCGTNGYGCNNNSRSCDSSLHLVCFVNP